VLRPAPDELLQGVAAQLEAQVLPHVSSGAAQRQLKASLHILRRLGRCWDRAPGYLADDCEDMWQTLDALQCENPELLGDATLRALLADATRRRGHLGVQGCRAPLSDLATLHLDLQRCVTDVDRRLRAQPGADPADGGALRDLYRRMLEREAFAWGMEGEDGD
jgi:hypothetical protein